jgi:5'-nucleotidase
LGQLDLVQTDSGDWEIEQYQLHELNDSTMGDPEINSVVDGFVAALEAGPLAELGYNFDTPIASIEGDVAVASCSESGLGDFVTDAFRQQLTALDPEHPIDVAIESQGVIRDDFIAGVTGMESFSDFFRVMPLGFGTDDVPGYSLVHFYMSGAEVADACEVTVSISPDYGCDYYIQVSGMRCNVDMSKSMFNRVVGVELQTDTGWESIDITRQNTEMYHIAVDSYVASLMYILEGLTFGGIVVEPKDENGVPLPNQTDWIFDRDPETEGIQEVKLWEALAGYADTFSDTTGDGVPDIVGYTEGEVRIIGFD